MERISVDLDRSNPFSLMACVLKGMVLFRKTPRFIRRSPSKHGWHIGWYDISCNEKQGYIYRYMLNDDKRRIHMDLIHGKRRKQTQILFFKKVFRVHTPDGVLTFNQFQKDKIFELQKRYQNTDSEVKND